MFKTKSSLSLSELARTYCPLRLTSAIGGSLTILLAKLAVWRLRLAPMCFGIVKRNRRYGSYLDFVDTHWAYYHEFVDLLWHLKFVQHGDNELLSLI